MKFGLLFTFQLPPGCGIPWNEPYQDMLDCLPHAEALGYESMFMATHHVKTDGLCPGPLIACAGAAAVTKTMRIGTAVLLVPMYAPLKLAEDIAVLDNLSQGRFVFGVALRCRRVRRTWDPAKGADRSFRGIARPDDHRMDPGRVRV